MNKVEVAKDLSGTFLSCSCAVMRQTKTHVTFTKKGKGRREHTSGQEG